MQENKASAADPPQVPESGQDSSSTFLPSSKLVRSVCTSRSISIDSSRHPLSQQGKLEKLADWRIDPSWIEFPEDTREFRGGFATVSQGLLAPASLPEGDESESEHTTSQPPSSESGNPEPAKDTQEPRDDHKGKDKGVDVPTADGDNDGTEGEEKKDNEEKQKVDNQNSIQQIEYGLASSENTADGDPNSGDRDTQSRSNIQRSEDDHQGENEVTESSIPDGDNGGIKEEARKPLENSKEEQITAASEPKQIVAVKKLKIEGDKDLERVLGLALRELKILVELSHPNVVRLEGFVEDLPEHKVWLVFPWEENGNLRDFLASGEWEIPERISLINDVTWGLGYLHAQEPPIYHGDLKSLNILVNSGFRALITDFGSARRLEEEPKPFGKQMRGNEDQPQSTPDATVGEQHITLEALFSATASTITLAGSSYTLRWAAPELLQDERPCLRSDIWSLGWIAYEVMTNTIPFHDIKKDAIVIKRVIQGHLPSITEDARMSLIRALCAMMVQCWSLDPDKRPSADECRKLISWMPMIVPAPTRPEDGEASQLRHARLLGQLGHMYREQGDYPSAQSCFTEALTIYTTHSDSKGRANSLRGLGDVHRWRNETTEAAPFYSEALQIYADIGDEWEKAHTIFSLADTHRLRYEYGEAAKLYTEYLHLFTNPGSKRQRALGLSGLATVHMVRGEYSEATSLYSEALQNFTDVGDLKGRANSLWFLAELHRAQNEYGEASKLYSEAAQIYTDIGDKHGQAVNLWSIAEMRRIQNESDEAIKLYSEAAQIQNDVGNYRAKAIALCGLAEVHRARHGYDEAIKLYSEARQLLSDVGDKYWEREALLGIAQAHQMQDNHSEAISFYTEASELFAEIGESSRASNASENAANIRESLENASNGITSTAEVENETLMTSGNVG